MRRFRNSSKQPATEKGEAKAKTNPVYAKLAGRLSKSMFKGYETTRVDDAKVVALIKGDEVESLNEGEEGESFSITRRSMPRAADRSEMSACSLVQPSALANVARYLFAGAGFDRSQGQSRKRHV